MKRAFILVLFMFIFYACKGKINTSLYDSNLYVKSLRSGQTFNLSKITEISLFEIKEDNVLYTKYRYSLEERLSRTIYFITVDKDNKILSIWTY